VSLHYLVKCIARFWLFCNSYWLFCATVCRRVRVWDDGKWWERWLLQRVGSMRVERHAGWWYRGTWRPRRAGWSRTRRRHVNVLNRRAPWSSAARVAIPLSADQSPHSRTLDDALMALYDQDDDHHHRHQQHQQQQAMMMRTDLQRATQTGAPNDTKRLRIYFGST